MPGDRISAEAKSARSLNLGAVQFINGSCRITKPGRYHPFARNCLLTCGRRREGTRGFHELLGHPGGGHRYLPEELTIKKTLSITTFREIGNESSPF